MTSRQTLDCRIYVAEDAMYRRSGMLNQELHKVEARIKALSDEIHRVLCRTAQTPMELKAEEIAVAIQAFERSIDIGLLRTEAAEVASLRATIETLEDEVAGTSLAREAVDSDALLRAPVGVG